MNAVSYIDAVLRAEPTATLAKVTVILAVTGVSAIALRRAPAAVRHVVWLAGLVSAASTMLLAPIAPGIAVPVARGATVDGRTSGPVDRWTRSVSREVPAASTSSDTRTPGVSADTPRAASRGVVRVLSSLATPAGLLILWAIGAAVVLSRALVGHVIVARVVRGGRRLNDVDLGAAAARLGARHVRLLASDRIATPITTRWRRPVVMLPESAAAWSDERRRIVFVHELAHIVRGDYAAQAVATFAAAALWFHPLAWLAVARLKAEAEHAADDVVLSSGTTGVVYASHLLELARAAAPLRVSAAVSVGVVRSSRVERRFEAILDDRRSRRGLGWRAISAAALGSAVILSPLAGVRTVARAMTPRVSQARPAPPPTQPTPIGRTAPPTRVLDVPRSPNSRVTDPESRGLTNGPSVDRYSSRPPSDRDRRGDVSMITNLGCASVSVGDRPAKRGFSISKDGGSIYLPLAPAGWALSTGGGRIVVDSTAGSIVAVTGGGDIDLKAASGDATVATGAGDVSVRVVGAPAAPHNVDVCNGYGRVTLDLPRDLDATIELETAYTDNAQHPTSINSDFDLSRSETHEWDDRFGTPRKFVRAVGKVGAGTSVIHVSTVNGDIVVRRR